MTHSVLDLHIEDGRTIRKYLLDTLEALVVDGEGFFGGKDFENPLMGPLFEAKLIPEEYDWDGYRRVMLEAVEALAKGH